jgi:hypothetical protein
MSGAAAATRAAADATAHVQHLRTSLADAATGRGLQPSAFQLNLSRF